MRPTSSTCPRRPRAPTGRSAWASLLADAAQVRFAVDALQRHRSVVRFDQCGPTRTALREAVETVAGALGATGSQLEHPGLAVPATADVSSVSASTRAPVRDCLQRHAHESARDGPLAVGLDAAVVRDLLVEVAVLADDALRTAASLPKG